MQDNIDSRKLRGKPAIQAAHVGVTGEDEARVDLTISSLYGVDSDEAADIHASYHVGRIFASLEQRARENGMKAQTLIERLQYLDVSGSAREVARGKVTEAAAVDSLFRGLSMIENPQRDDRYINFYG